MFCPNPECPSASSGEAPEYRAGLTECSDCGSQLVEARPEWELVDYARFERVFEIGNAALVPVVDSLLQTAGIRFFFKGVGTGLDFVSGPAKVYVEPDRAEEARELLKELGEPSDVGDGDGTEESQ
jgi:hypothetical protein